METTMAYWRTANTQNSVENETLLENVSDNDTMLLNLLTLI